MSKDYQILMFYIPCASDRSSAQLGKAAINAKLAVCYNLIPVNSYYPWDGQMVSDKEVTLVLKTSIDLEEELSKFIEEHHEYEIPCIARWKVAVNKSYFQWINKNIK